ncbi:UNVERIFIED_CONTAM: hypothetical protein Sindi_0363500 [Sesamum indicum]
MSVDKSEPVTEGGGLKGDQINSLTSYRYNLKKILVKEVLWLAHLNPTLLQVRGSLDNMVLQARVVQCIRAAQGRAATEVALARSEPDSSATPDAEIPRDVAPIEIGSKDTRPLEPSQSNTPPNNMVLQARVVQCIRAAQGRAATEVALARSEPDSSATPDAEIPRDVAPIEIGSKDTRPLELVKQTGRSSSPNVDIVGSKENSPAGEEEGAPSGSRKKCKHRRNNKSALRSSKHSKSRSPRQEEEAAATKAEEEKKNMEMLKEHQSSQHTIRTGFLGAIQCELSFSRPSYPLEDLIHSSRRALCSLLDAGNSAANFVCGLSLKCSGFRKKQIVAERKNRKLQGKITKVSAREGDLESQRAALEARNKELEALLASEVAKALAEGKEIRFSAGEDEFVALLEEIEDK